MTIHSKFQLHIRRLYHLFNTGKKFNWFQRPSNSSWPRAVSNVGRLSNFFWRKVSTFHTPTSLFQTDKTHQQVFNIWQRLHIHGNGLYPKIRWNVPPYSRASMSWLFRMVIWDIHRLCSASNLLDRWHLTEDKQVFLTHKIWSIRRTVDHAEQAFNNPQAFSCDKLLKHAERPHKQVWSFFFEQIVQVKKQENHGCNFPGWQHDPVLVECWGANINTLLKS